MQIKGDDEELHKFVVEKTALAYQVVANTELVKEKQLEEASSTPAPRNTLNKAILHQIFATCAILLMSLACGLPIGYSSTLLPQLMSANKSANEIDITANMATWIVSIHSLATPSGSFISGPLADHFGRRTTLMLSIAPMVIGWCAICWAQTDYMIVLGRFFCGFATGILGGPAQIYIAETASASLRSLLIGAPFVSYSAGILIVYAMGANMHWRDVAFYSAVFPLVALCGLLYVPESPVWLTRFNKIKKAEKALRFLRCDETVVQNELNEMLSRLKEERATTKENENIFKLCSQPSSYKPLFIVIIISKLQMLTGPFLVIFYAADLVQEIGFNVDSRKSIMILTAVVRLFCTLIFCVILLFVRRRKIMTISGIGSGLTALVLTVLLYANNGQKLSSSEVYVASFSLLLYIAFNTPLMIMPAVMIELMPARLRGRLAGTIFAFMNFFLFILAKYFLVIKEVIQLPGVFAMFTISNIISVTFMYLFQPETKGRTLAQIEDYFKQSNWLWHKRDKTYKKAQLLERNHV